MKLFIYVWEKNRHSGNLCAVCGNQAYRSFYNDSKVGSQLPAWYVCYRKECSVFVSLLVLDDCGARPL